MQNPFETLGIEPTFALSAETLAERQRALNQAVHPDRHAGKSPVERRAALHRAMDVNQAIRTLRDPSLRADALLSLLGRSRSSLATGGAATDPALLMQVMEQREALEAARKSADRPRLRELRVGVAEREEKVLRALEGGFAALLSARTTGELDPTVLEGVERVAGELRYLRRFSDELDACEDEL